MHRAPGIITALSVSLSTEGNRVILLGLGMSESEQGEKWPGEPVSGY